VEGQVVKVIKKAYGILAFLGIGYKSREVMLELYKMLVWPQLEYSR